MLLLAACGGRDGQLSDWERENQDRLAREAVDKETVNRFPALPQPKDLMEFGVDGASSFRFYVDRASLSVAEGGVVRYTLVARSAGGVENISYEGARCPTGEHRIYAVASGGAWRASPGGWKPLAQRWDAVLHREYFCPQSVPIRNVAEGVRALQDGGHPFSRGFSADPYRSR